MIFYDIEIGRTIYCWHKPLMGHIKTDPLLVWKYQQVAAIIMLSVGSEIWNHGLCNNKTHIRRIKHKIILKMWMHQAHINSQLR